MGELDICDTKDKFLSTYEIEIKIPNKYPYGVPVLIEIGNKIPRDDDRHIDDFGTCCVDLDHELEFRSRKKFFLVDFIKEKVYPYLSNQIHFDKEKEFANGEWGHGFKGVKQFYTSKLKINDNQLTVDILNAILDNKIPGRNADCFCGESKFKKCIHYGSVMYLMSVTKLQLAKDLRGFMIFQSEKSSINKTKIIK